VRRMLVAALLVVALVGMHHLVATGCALDVDSHEVTHVADVDRQTTTASPHVSGSHPVVDFDLVQPPAGSGTATEPATAMTCVAILLILVLLIRPGSWCRQGSRLGVQRSERRVGITSVVQAPDLHQLSISRT
jgi:hypothetical protein